VSRSIHARYVDPLSQLWLGCARAIGLRVVRSGDAYAATDGGGTLVIGDDASLDADDSLAQMIFHELCHSLVEGPESFTRADWGMDNVTDDDHWREHACLRLQRVLATRYGLEHLFAPTTDFRAFWDALPADPLADRGEPSVVAAILGLERVDDPPWAPALASALAATARIAAEVRAAARVDAPSDAAQPALWDRVAPPPAPHPTGLPAGPAAAASPDRSCGTCAWRYVGGPGPRAERCRQAEGARVDVAWPGCERWEPALDCLTCGACCRAAYGAVEVGRTERFVKRHPALVVDRGSYVEILRAGDRCAALTGGATERRADGTRGTTPYACVVYADRPKTCRDFTLGSEHCLTARRRVGLSL
jgi:Fe-S-cluster containining protein